MVIRDRRPDDKVLVFGHRGNVKKEIENTLSSFSSAMECGADGIELDVHITSDDKLIVFHDFNTERVFGENIFVEDKTLDEIKTRFPLIPTLDEVFSLIGPVYYDIEIKAEYKYSKKLIPMLWNELERRKEFQDKIMISSFNPMAMREFSHISSHHFTQAIIYEGKPTTLPFLLQRGQGRLFFPCDVLKPKYDIAIREKNTKKKYPIAPWTVDSRDVLKSILDTKCPIIITNEPEDMAKALEEIALH